MGNIGGRFMVTGFNYIPKTIIYKHEFARIFDNPLQSVLYGFGVVKLAQNIFRVTDAST